MKTKRFGSFRYIGDPANTVRIFNELEVDELMLFDITATREGRGPNLKILSEIADECFMPLAYGGGISSIEEAKAVFDIGFEKVCLNSYALEHPPLVADLASRYGSQAVVVSIDVKRRPLFSKYKVVSRGATRKSRWHPVEWANEVAGLGAGEILLTSVDREGTWAGFDLDLVRSVTDSVDVPVIAHGGAGKIEHIEAVVQEAGASAVCLGSMVVFQKKEMGVLVNFPDHQRLRAVLP